MDGITVALDLDDHIFKNGRKRREREREREKTLSYSFVAFLNSQKFPTANKPN